MSQIRTVPPLKIIDIRKTARNLRDALGVTSAIFPIVEEFEKLVNLGFFEFEILEQADMPESYGLYIPERNCIQIRMDIYEKARIGDGFAKSTMAHELGHWILEHGKSVSLARSVSLSSPKTVEDPEWQAGKFAQEFLIDIRLLPSSACASSIAEQFSTTLQMAEVAYRSLKREGIIK